MQSSENEYSISLKLRAFDLGIIPGKKWKRRLTLRLIIASVTSKDDVVSARLCALYMRHVSRSNVNDDGDPLMSISLVPFGGFFLSS